MPGGAERRGCGRQLLRSPALIAGGRAPNSESAPGLVGTAHRLGGEVVAAAPALRGRPRPYPRPRARRQRCRPALFPGPSGGSSRRLLFNTLPRERALPAPQIPRHLAANSGTGTSATQKNPTRGGSGPLALPWHLPGARSQVCRRCPAAGHQPGGHRELAALRTPPLPGPTAPPSLPFPSFPLPSLPWPRCTVPLSRDTVPRRPRQEAGSNP